MRSQINAILVTFVAFSLALASSDRSLAVQRIENFDDDPLWIGLNNAGRGTNNYGFSDTSNAGGTAGEVGGAIQSRTNFPGYYADTVDVGPMGQQMLTANGRLTSGADLTGFDGGFLFGWFDANESFNGGLNTPDKSVVMGVFDGGSANPPGTYRIGARLNGPNEAGSVAGNNLVLNPDTDYLFNMEYNPNGGGLDLGELTLTITLASDNSPVGTSKATRTALTPPNPTLNLNAFGIVNLRLGEKPAGDFFIDNLDYTVMGFLGGDYNDDGGVNATDFDAWSAGFGTASEATRSNGDANGDGDVDGGDFLVWQQDFGMGTVSSVYGGSVPEPATILLGASCVAGAARGRVRRPSKQNSYQ